MAKSSRGINQQACIVVNDENYETIIPLFCSSILNTKQENASVSGAQIETRSQKALRSLLLDLKRPYTIIQEQCHIDKDFRDAYYMYFSNQYFETNRYSRRLSFIYGQLSFDQYMFAESKSIEDMFMGTCVINPTVSGAIGRTLINPEYLIGSDLRPVYMRLSNFSVHIYGREFHVEAFPYRMQDEETTRCAEVTLLNILEYFSNTYHDYRSVTPSEIIQSEQEHNHERVLPSRGMPITILTKVLSDFGYAPRLYNLFAFDDYYMSHVTRDEELKRLLHYYVTSGVPVALNLIPRDSSIMEAHSVACVGHGRLKKELFNEAKRNRNILWSSKGETHPIINSADLYNEYIVVDDNTPIYQVRNYNDLSDNFDMRLENIAVPLYKRMFLDAPNAYSTVITLLRKRPFTVDDWAEGYLLKGEDIVVRLFMASSKNFKEHRKTTLSNSGAQVFYAALNLPRFIWVCELYKSEDYLNEGDAFGEIVLDATSAPNRGHRSLILLHYPGVIAYRDMEQADMTFSESIRLKTIEKLSPYDKNLSKIG